MSYWKGDTSVPLETTTIGQLVEQAAIKYPNKNAISFYGGQRLTYAEVLDKVDILAAAYINLGLQSGDHLAIWGFNSVEWYLSFFAAIRAGLVVVNLNPLYQAAELFDCLKIGDVSALVMDEQLGKQNFYEILTTAIPEIEDFHPNTHLMSERVPCLKTVIMFSKTPHKGIFNWDSLFSSVSDEQRREIRSIQWEINPFDVCNLQFTSGTTGHPKGVLLTHHSLVNAAFIAARHKGLLEKEHRICLPLPFFHSYGLVHGILVALSSGCPLILPSAKFSPNQLVDCIIDEKCTFIYGTPTMYNDILTVSLERAATDGHIFEKMSSVKGFHVGGAPTLPHLKSQLKKFFKGSQLMSGYGMTETSATTLASSLHDSDEILLSTVGRVYDHIEVKVVDENNEIVPFGVSGELCCRGFVVMKGYYKEPEKTKAVLTPDGWLRTGDKFILMENGYAQIVGRFKDLIIRGGENIQPQEVEEVIIKHPDIIDVQVYGVKDIRLGEAVAAAVIKKANSSLTADDVKNYCNKAIASYKIPRYVIFVEEFPRTASGKVQKYKLRKITEERVVTK